MYRMRNVIAGLLWAVLVWGSAFTGAWAQDSLRKENLSISLDEIKLDTLLNKNKFSVKVNVATKTSVDVENTPGTVTVITRDQIVATQARNLRQLLNIYVPSLDVLPSGFRHGLPVSETIYSRGNVSDFSQQVLILYNGTVKFNESTLGSYFTSSEFTLENVERIEVSTTPTTIYGANAVTVINIVTHEQSIDGAEASVSAGLNTRYSDDVFQSQRYSVLWGNTLKKLHIGASLRYMRDFGQAHPFESYTGGFRSDPKTLRDGMKSAALLTLHFKDIGEKYEGGIWYMFNNRDAFMSGLSSAQSNDLLGFFGQQIMSYFKYNGKQFNFNSGLMLSEMGTSYEQAKVINGSLFVLPVYTRFSNYSVFIEGNWNRKFEFIGKHELIIGLRGERDGQFDTDSRIFIGNAYQNEENAQLPPNNGRFITSAFIEDNWKITKNTSLLLGARSDYFIGFGDNRTLAFNPRLSVVRHVGNFLILKAIAARTFRAPTIYELSGQGIPGLRGSSNVTAEVITVFEFNLLFKKDRFNFSITPFYQIFESRIRFRALPENPTVLVAQNLSQRVVGGVEAQTKLFFNEERTSFFFINGSYLIPSDPNEFHFVPRLYAGSGFNVQFGKFNLNLTAYLRGNRNLPPELIRNKEFARTQLLGNIALTYRAGKAISAFIMGDQLAPRQYAVPLNIDGVVHPLRSPMITIGVNVTPF